MSGLTLTYEETRTNCIPLDSDLFPTVDWPFLRVWAGDNGAEVIYFVKLYDPAYATPIEGSFVNAYADFTLHGHGHARATTSVLRTWQNISHIELFFDDTPTTAAQAIVDAINTSPILKAESCWHQHGAGLLHCGRVHRGQHYGSEWESDRDLFV